MKKLLKELKTLKGSIQMMEGISSDPGGIWRHCLSMQIEGKENECQPRAEPSEECEGQ